MSALRQRLPKISRPTETMDWRGVASAISSFEALDSELRQAIERNDDERIAELDAQLQAKFLEILTMQPRMDSGLKQQTEFLLEQLIPSASRSFVKAQICTKLVDNICKSN